MSTPRGAIDATFKNTSREKNLLACIIFARSLQERPHVLNTAASRNQFFKRKRKDLRALYDLDRNSPAPNYANLPHFERQHGIRIFIWRRIDELHINVVYISSNANLNACRVNILSQSDDDRDLR